jgi:sugar phosphate permease
MTAAPPRAAGAASGFVNTTQQAGGVAGLAVVATVAGAHGRSAGFLVAAGALALGALVAGHLTAASVRHRRPDAGRRPPAEVGTPTLERC